MEQITTFAQFKAISEELWNNPSKNRRAEIVKALTQLAKSQKLNSYYNLYYVDIASFVKAIEQAFENNGKTASVKFSPYKEDYYAPYDDDCNYGTVLTIMVDGQPKLEIDFYHNIYLSTTKTHIPTEIEIGHLLTLTDYNWNRFALAYPFVQNTLWEALRLVLCKNRIADYTIIQKMIAENNFILNKLKSPYFVASEIAKRQEENDKLNKKLKELKMHLDEINFKLE